MSSIASDNRYFEIQVASGGFMAVGHVIVLLSMLLVADVALADSHRIVREGDGAYGKIILSVDGNRVRLGGSSYGSVLYILDGNKIREGASPYGNVIATVQPDGRVTEGSSSYGRTIATVKHGKVREGVSSFGEVIANTDGGRMSGAAAATHILLR